MTKLQSAGIRVYLEENGRTYKAYATVDRVKAEDGTQEKFDVASDASIHTTPDAAVIQAIQRSKMFE